MADDASAEDLTREIEALRTERDQLAAEAAELERAVHGGRGRRLGVTALVVLTCISFLAASLGFWANRNLLSTDVWVDRVGPLASDPAVQEALAATITDETMSLIDPDELFEQALPDGGKILAVPLSNVLRNFVNDLVLDFVRSDAFAKLWVTLNENGHAAAVALLRGETPSDAISTEDGKVTVSLLPAIDAVLARISESSPEILGRDIDIPEVSTDDLPAEARQRIGDALGVDVGEDFGVITVYDSDALSSTQQAIKVFDTLMPLMIVLTIALVALTLYLSRRRRRTGLQLLVGFALVLVLIRRITLILVDSVVDLAQIPGNQAALESILEAFADPLLASTQLMLIGLAVVAAILAVSGPYPWAVRLRRSVAAVARTTFDMATDADRQEASIDWMRTHVLALQWAGALVFVAALWWLNLSWLALAALAAAIGAFELWVSRLAEPATAPDEPDADLADAS